MRLTVAVSARGLLLASSPKTGAACGVLKGAVTNMIVPGQPTDE